MKTQLSALAIGTCLLLVGGCGEAADGAAVGETKSGDLVPLTVGPPVNDPEPSRTVPVDPEVEVAATELVGRVYEDPQLLDPNDPKAVPRMLGMGDGYDLISTQPMWGEEGPVGMVVTLQHNAAPESGRQTILAVVRDPDPSGAIWGDVVSTISVRLKAEEQLSTVHQGCRKEKVETPTSMIIGVVSVAADAGAEQYPRVAWSVDPTGAFIELDPASVICSLSVES